MFSVAQTVASRTSTAGGLEDSATFACLPFGVFFPLPSPLLSFPLPLGSEASVVRLGDGLALGFGFAFGSGFAVSGLLSLLACMYGQFCLTQLSGQLKKWHSLVTSGREIQH